MSSPLRIRPPRSPDSRELRRLIEAEFAGTPFAEAARSAVQEALGGSAESRALVAESDDSVVGVVVFGPVAGTEGTGKLHLIVVTATARLQGIARRLCDAAVSTLVEEGARLVVAEMADTPALRPGRMLLQRCGWREEGRVEDFYADGIALLLLRRDAEA